MAAKEIHYEGPIDVKPRKYSCLAADTSAWQAANKAKLPNGSELKEVDGTKKLYQLHDGEWYDVTPA